MKLPEQDFDLNEENVGVFLPGRKLESMTFTSPMTTCKIALCTPKAKYNKPWDELRCLYESFLLKDSARWYHAVYFRMLSSEFMGEFVGSDSRLVNLQRTFEDQGRAVFDRRFVYGKSDHPLGYVPAEVELDSFFKDLFRGVCISVSLVEAASRGQGSACWRAPGALPDPPW